VSEISETLAMKILDRMPGESDRAYQDRVVAWISGDDVRTKTDLRDWTGSLPFHLNREPS
jgi:hypothetical protein